MLPLRESVLPKTHRASRACQSLMEGAMSLKLNDIEINKKKKIRRGHLLEARSRGNLSANKRGGELHVCVRGACDNYTMVCVCFSWALSFSRSPLTLKGRVGRGEGGQRPAGNYAVSRTVKSDTLGFFGGEGI